MIILGIKVKMETDYLKEKAKEVRKNILDSVYHSGAGHTAPSLSWTDIGVSLFFKEMNLNHGDRDTFILSKGHAAPGLYAILAAKGYIEQEELKNLRKIDSPLQGHPVVGYLPFIDASTGSLGQGLSMGVGYAIGNKSQGKKGNVYVVLGDGESQKGQIWEAAMSATKFAEQGRMNKLTAILDYNKFQGEHSIKDTMPSLAPLEKKWSSFGWHTQVVDGHDLECLLGAYENAKKIENMPSMIIANTTKGKGVSFMEQDPVKWHGGAVKKEDYDKAVKELK
jgi:transketolase